jgi:tetrahydromethanopterin S-methyltransferase subunit G
MAHLEGAFEQIGRHLASIDSRFASIDSRFASIDARLDAMDSKIDFVYRALDAKIDSRFMWTIGVVLGSWLTTIAGIFLHR